MALKKYKRVSGFTLVEMAIVLVIIGIILAGIMKGRDIVRGSQVKQFSQGFAQKWVTIASTYMDKTGQALCDGADNGGRAGQAVDGRMDNVFFGTAAMAGVYYDNLVQALRDVGITPCTMIKSDLENDTNALCNGQGYNVFMRTVEGEWTGKATVVMGLHSKQIGDDTGPYRNVVTFSNVPADVVQGLDTLIDGQADPANGACLLLDNYADEDADDPPDILADPDIEPLTAYPASDGDQFCVIAIVLDY